MGNNNWIIINLDENKNYIDIIYIIINFLKFYHIILFKKLVYQKFIQNFVEVCELCCKSSLIYSTILIDIDEDSDITKTPLEIILDICIFYLTFCSTKFSDNVLNNKKVIQFFILMIILGYYLQIIQLMVKRGQKMRILFLIF